MRRLKYPVIQIVVMAALCLIPLSVAGQEKAATEPAPTPPETVTAPETAVASEPEIAPPTSAGDQLLESEFELLQEPTIESVSKRSESLFDSPLSADVITRDMIQRSGVRTIPEALRLLPGMIVYEQSSGNFDVHVRGFDNIQPGSMLQEFVSTTLLVMIDYRVVYNYLQGGTYWETLPVDIIDVERIELVRGPVAALYGPNAVSGVINIITRKYTTNGPHVNAQAEGALSTTDYKWKNGFNLGQWSTSGRIGYKNKNLSGGISTNYRHYDRFDDRLFSWRTGTRIAERDNLDTALGQAYTPNLINEPKLAYPEPGLAYRNASANGFFAYEPNDKLSFVFNVGYQESRTVREYFDNLHLSPQATHQSELSYLDFRSHFYDFTLHGSFLIGHQMIPGNRITYPSLDEPSGSITKERYSYDLNTLDVNLDYNFVWKWLRVRPGVSYRRAQYSGLLFAEWDGERTSGETKSIRSAAVSVALEQALWKRLRLVEAVRLDIYFDRTEYSYYAIGSDGPTTKHGKILYPSVELAATYTPAEDHILRISYGRASKSPSMIESYFGGPLLEIGGARALVLGNKAIDLVTFDTVEIGYRTRISKQIDLSFEVFGTHAFDFSNFFYHAIDSDSTGNYYVVFQFDDLDLDVWQVGGTVSLGFTSHRLQGRIFATVQQTRLENHAPEVMYCTFNILREECRNFHPLDPNWQKDTTHKGTPDLFGGFYVNYQPADRWNINVSAYFFSQRTQIHFDIPTNNSDNPVTKGSEEIQQSFLLNAKVSYNFWDGLTAFVNIRNLFNINQPQYIWGDPNHILCFIGLQYDL